MCHSPRDLVYAAAMATADQSDAILSASPGVSSIVGRLRRAIMTGVYADGDRIPPERNLAAVFGAARSTIRKALDQLEADGLIVRRVGSGTFVNFAGPVGGHTDEVADFISPLQLIDARMAVEPYMARLAALHATQRDLEAMGAVLGRLEAAGSDKNAFTEHDVQFHLCLARSSRNPLLLHVYGEINQVRARGQWDAMKEKILTSRQIAAYNRQHRQIYEALCRRDAQAVAELITEHLEKARQDLIGAHSG